MKDKHGYEYSELTRVQSEHLKVWSTRVVMPLLNSVVEYVQATNRAAANENEAHRVYRGQDLVQIITDWPDLKPCYVPRATASATDFL